MECALVTPFADALDTVDPRAAAASRLLFSERLEHALRRWMPNLGIGPVRASDDGEGRAGERFSLTWRAPGAELTLVIPWSIDVVCASILAAGSWSAEVQMACLCARASSVLGGAMDWLAANGLHAVGLERRCEPLAQAPGDTLFDCRIGRHRIQARLRCTDPAWLSVVASELVRQVGSRLGAVSDLPIPVRVSLGERRLGLGLLQSLAIGDVLLLDKQCGPEDSIDTVRFLVGRRGQGSLAWHGVARGREITAKGDRWMNTATSSARSAMEEDAAARHPRPGRDPISDIEVDVHLELQVLSTPIGELAAMQPGYILELPVPASQACVDLVIGGQVHGRAQLVRVGDRLGARIIELFREPV